MKVLLIFATLLLYSYTDSLKGIVVRVFDGDTITILVESKQVKIRLEGIDCPESKQDYGFRAKQLTSELCFGKEVLVIVSGTDRYDRTLGFVYVDDLCVNEELLKQGMAWHYKKYNKDENLAQMESTARRNKIGLWSIQNPIAPWDYRK